MEKSIIIAVVSVPIIGALFIPLLSRLSRSLRNYAALAFTAAPFILSLKLIPLALSGQRVSFSHHLALGFNLAFLADGLAIFMALVSSLISAVIVLYSLSYISHYDNQDEYYSMVALFLGAMMGLVFSANLILLYIFWEITAIASWRLIGFFREKGHVLRADKALLVTVSGALFMLIGFLILYQSAGSFDLPVIRGYFKLHPASSLAVALMLIGIFSKSATLPFHVWLPDAGVAPSPVTALLHAAVLVKIGVYVFARIFIVNITPDALWHTVVPLIAGLSAIVSAGAALVETDLKRIIAYSTISQIAFIFLGLSVGNGIAITGALLYILMHGLAKGGLFLCAGIVEQNAKTKNITKLGGLINTMPVTAASFFLCALSIMGVPPLGGFFSKYMVFSGTLAQGNWVITAIFLAGAFLTIIYLFRVFNLVFMGEAKSGAKEGSPLMLLSVGLLALLSLIAGVFIAYPYNLAQAATLGMLGAVK